MGAPSPPPAPDYGPLAQASQEQLKVAKQISQDQLNWAKEQYADNKPFADEFRRKTLETLDKNTAESDAQLARYKSLYYPVEDEYVKDVMDWDSPGRIERERSRAVATVGSAFDRADAAATRRLEMEGVDPSETRFSALNRGSKLMRAAAQAGAANESDRAIDTQALALKANTLGIGRGQPAQALGFQTAGVNAGKAGIDTSNSTTAGAAGSLGNPLGWHAAGTNAIGTWGNVLNAGYQNQIAGYKAADEVGSGWGQALGAGVGLAGMLMMAEDGGEVPDEQDLMEGSFAGAVPTVKMAGRRLDPSLSPSGGEQTDDIPAVGPGGSRIQVDSGEFIIPRRTVEWYGEKHLQNLIMKADKEMGAAPAKPEIKAVDTGGGVPAMARGGGVPRMDRPSVSAMPRRMRAIDTRTVPAFNRRAA